MYITVEVFAETVSTGARQHTHTAHVVFVAIDQQRRPTQVPRLAPGTEEEQRRYELARARYEARKQA
jgi:acyl-CoA hydrolase